MADILSIYYNIADSFDLFAVFCNFESNKVLENMVIN